MLEAQESGSELTCQAAARVARARAPCIRVGVAVEKPGAPQARAGWCAPSVTTPSRKRARAAPPAPSLQDPLRSKAKRTIPGPRVLESKLGTGPTQTTHRSRDPAAAGSLGLENWTTEGAPPRCTPELGSSVAATWCREQGGLPTAAGGAGRALGLGLATSRPGDRSEGQALAGRMARGSCKFL